MSGTKSLRGSLMAVGLAALLLSFGAVATAGPEDKQAPAPAAAPAKPAPATAPKGPAGAETDPDAPPKPPITFHNESMIERADGTVSYFYRTNFAEAADLIAALKAGGFTQLLGPPPPGIKDNLRAVKGQNVLVIDGDPEGVEMVLDAIAYFDVAAPQVFVEAKVLEVTYDSNFEFGVDYDWSRAEFGPGTLFQGAGGILNPPSLLRGGFPPAFPFQGSELLFGLVGKKRDKWGALDIAIQALQIRGKAEVLSKPSIIATQGIEARVETTEQRSQAILSEARNADTIFRTTSVKSGVSLIVTPTHIGDAFVTLQINPSVQGLAGLAVNQAGGTFAPIQTTRSAKTTVTLGDGETLVIGGLYTNTKTMERARTPFLCPTCRCWANCSHVRPRPRQRPELIFILTPHIVRKTKDSEVHHTARGVGASGESGGQEGLQEEEPRHPAAAGLGCALPRRLIRVPARLPLGTGSVCPAGCIAHQGDRLGNRSVVDGWPGRRRRKADEDAAWWSTQGRERSDRRTAVEHPASRTSPRFAKLTHFRPLVLACLACAWMGAGCASQVTHELPVVDASQLQIQVEDRATANADDAHDSFEIGGVWRRNLEPFERQEVVLAAATAGRSTPAPPNEDRLREAVIDHRLHRSQYRRRLAVGIHETLEIAFRALEQRAHQQHGLEHVLRKLGPVILETRERARGNTAVHCGLRHRGREFRDQARVERFRNEVLRTELQRFAAVGGQDEIGRFLVGEFRECLHAGELHLLVDRGRADVERTAEQVRETQHVVDLVRVIGATRRDDRVRPCGTRLFREDLRRRIREREDERPIAHGFHHLAGQHARTRQAEKDVRARNGLGERAMRRVAREERLVLVQSVRRVPRKSRPRDP